MRGGEEEQPNFAFNWNIGIIYFTPPRREGGSLENARSGEDERERKKKREREELEIFFDPRKRERKRKKGRIEEEDA